MALLCLDKTYAHDGWPPRAVIKLVEIYFFKNDVLNVIQLNSFLPGLFLDFF